jgi:hypothetical protein
MLVMAFSWGRPAAASTAPTRAQDRHRACCTKWGGPHILDIATAQVSRILPVGLGTGLAGCTENCPLRRRRRYAWNKFIDSPADSVLALAAYDTAWEALAMGFSDGTVVLHPSADVQPDRRSPSSPAKYVPAHPVGGGKRGDRERPPRTHTRRMLVRIEGCPRCLSNKAMARAAGQRLR